MILLLDTSSPVCRLSLVDNGRRTDDEWQADRQLADGLLAYIESRLADADASWEDLTGIGVFKGPGSFTGLRIGMSVLNTIANTKQIPIVSATGDGWQEEAVKRLSAGENERIALPFYGREANITKPRK